jgi:hypothetical protein
MPANQKIQTKIIERVDVALYISDEQHAAVMFPNTRGGIDMGTILLEATQNFMNDAMTSLITIGSTEAILTQEGQQ